MAVYERLLLSAGGGIVFPSQQANQAEDTATVLIGIGGTGVDCLRTIKTQVHACLRADSFETIQPTYQHIRFLGVDCDDHCTRRDARDGLLPLKLEEYFSIANPNVIQAFGNKQALTIRREFSWLQHEDILVSNLTNDSCRGGVRQIGRFLMMDRSAGFIARVQQEINCAKAGLHHPRVYVHVFSGLSGGTGGGCFLDVCYMVRHVAEQMVDDITTLGYFFLPDVNLTKIPMSCDTVRQHLSINGYSSLQELDYCMNLPYNGGAFTQEYQGKTMVRWDRPPVDVAFLVGATDANANVFPDAYKHSLNVTAEYVLQHLVSHKNNWNLTDEVVIKLHAKKRAMSQNRVGANTSYCALGASCGSLPLRQVNTYLASELFSRFPTKGGNIPGKADVDALSREVLCRAGSESVYDSLLAEIQEGACENYAPYQDDCKYVLNYGDKDLIEHYAKQTAAKSGIVECNAKNLIGASNQDSLLSRMASALEGVIRDADRGPGFACELFFSARGYSLLNVINGLIDQNHANLMLEGARTQRFKDCESAQRDFVLRRRRTIFDSDQKRFADLESCLCLLEEHKYMLGVYEQLDCVLRALREQVRGAASGYYRLARVAYSIIETIAENRRVLASAKALNDGDGFSVPFMTVAAFRKYMDAEIARINIPGMFDNFMGLLLDNPEVWLQEDGGQICRLVTDFLVGTAFHDFMDHSITAFLRGRCGTATDGEFYQDWLVRLTAMAVPLLCIDGLYRGAVPLAEPLSCVLSVPTASTFIRAEAQRMQIANSEWQIERSELADRICVLSVATVIPAFACSGVRQWEGAYFSQNSVGTHLYETPGLEGMPFSDWRLLPSLVPQSLIDASSIPETLVGIVCSGRELFDSCRTKGVIDAEGVIRALDERSARYAQRLLEVGECALEEFELQSVSELLARLDCQVLPLVPTKLRLTRCSNEKLLHDEEGFRKLCMDRFVSAPALQSVARRELERIEQLEHDLSELQERLREHLCLHTLNEAAEGQLTGDEEDSEIVAETYGVEGDENPELKKSLIEEHVTQEGYEGESIDV